MVKEFKNVLQEYVEFLRGKMKEGQKVIIKEEEVKELEVIMHKKGSVEDFSVIVTYKNGDTELMRATKFLEKMVEIRR